MTSNLRASSTFRLIDFPHESSPASSTFLRSRKVNRAGSLADDEFSSGCCRVSCYLWPKFAGLKRRWQTGGQEFRTIQFLRFPSEQMWLRNFATTSLSLSLSLSLILSYCNRLENFPCYWKLQIIFLYGSSIITSHDAGLNLRGFSVYRRVFVVWRVRKIRL